MYICVYMCVCVCLNNGLSIELLKSCLVSQKKTLCIYTQIQPNHLIQYMQHFSSIFQGEKNSFKISMLMLDVTVHAQNPNTRTRRLKVRVIQSVSILRKKNSDLLLLTNKKAPGSQPKAALLWFFLLVKNCLIWLYLISPQKASWKEKKPK